MPAVVQNATACAVIAEHPVAQAVAGRETKVRHQVVAGIAVGSIQTCRCQSQAFAQRLDSHRNGDRQTGDAPRQGTGIGQGRIHAVVAQVASQGKIRTVAAAAHQATQSRRVVFIDHDHVIARRQAVEAVVAAGVRGLGSRHGCARRCAARTQIHIDRDPGDARFGSILDAVIGHAAACAVIAEHPVA